MPDKPALIEKIVAFIEGVGIPVVREPVADDTLLPGATVRDGALVFDPVRIPYPGDLLHEAGHIAVTDPAIRATLPEVGPDGGEEMAAMAWSYAAALATGIDPAIVFHEHGYKGGAETLLDAFRTGGNLGVPLLVWYGMTAEPKNAEALGMPPFPAMTHWLRQTSVINQPE